VNKSLFEFKGIRRKIFAHLLITTLIMGITSIYSYYNAKIVIDRLKSIFTDYVYLNNLNNDINYSRDRSGKIPFDEIIRFTSQLLYD